MSAADLDAGGRAWVLLLGAAGLLLAVPIACAGPELEPVEALAPTRAPEQVADPGPPAPAVAPLAPRCARICSHILAMTGEGVGAGEARAWQGECQRLCSIDASEGQLRCYERVRSADELQACGVW